jgi:hypothetical protein
MSVIVKPRRNEEAQALIGLSSHTKRIINIIPLYFKIGRDVDRSDGYHHITGRNGKSYEKFRGERPLFHDITNTKQVCQLMKLDVLL